MQNEKMLAKQLFAKHYGSPLDLVPWILETWKNIVEPSDQ